MCQNRKYVSAHAAAIRIYGSGVTYPGYAEGRHRKGAPNRPKMWDNFATLTAQLAKSCVLVDNLVILRDFLTTF